MTAVAAATLPTERGLVPGEWDRDEIRTVLDEYFDMLRLEVRGESYVKVEHNRNVQDQTGRAKGSVEFKFQNVSAVLQDLGRVWIRGYKPRSNYQGLLFEEVQRRLDGGELDWLPFADELAVTASGPATPTTDTSDEGAMPAGYVGALARLQERAFGGADVAVAPDREQDMFWPQGPTAPGAEELVRWLEDRTREDAAPVLAFLVGGPGNGKSYLASLLVQNMDRLGKVEEGLATRTYRYDTGGPRQLNVVNDATISRDTEGLVRGAPLVSDIEEAVATGEHLLANVNRGILFEELAADAPAGVGRHVVEWLQGHDVEGREQGGWLLENRVAEDFFLSAELRGPDGAVVEVAAVLMDVCSLFERRPEVVLSEAGPTGIDTQVGLYEIGRLHKRDGWHISETPAGALLHKFMGQFPEPDPHLTVDYDPFRANLTTLKNQTVQNRVCTIIRAAELAAAKRLTYRELWGAVARLVVGDSPQFVRPGAGPFALVEARDPEDLRLEDMLELAAFRSHEALFGAPRCPLLRQTSPRTSPVTRITVLVDPARDARPGTGRPDGWADFVLEAFAGHATGGRPLSELLGLVPEDDPVRDAVTGFDHMLDDQVSAAMQERGRPDHQKRVLIAWYGQYLTRLYAFANGIPGFFNELLIWVRAWRKADGHAAPPAELEHGLRTLLLPSMDPDDPTSPFVLPALEPRTLPVSGPTDEPRLVVKVPLAMSLALDKEGDALFVKMKEGGVDRVELELDFAMLREALACREGHVGVTEFTDTASPRLERFRAALLTPGRTAGVQYALVDGTRVHELEVD